MKIKLILLCFLINILTINNINAEVLLYSDDTFEVTAPSYVTNEKKQILLAKGSELTIKVNPPILNFSSTTIEFGEYNKINLDITNDLNKVILRMDNSKVENTDNIFHKYFSMKDNRYMIKIPLDFDSGEYNLKLNMIDDKSVIKKLEQYFIVSNSFYQIDSINVIVEDKLLQGSINYSAFNEDALDENVKVIIKLYNGEDVIFTSEKENNLSGNGSIALYEKIQGKIDSSKPLDISVEVLNSDNDILFTKIQNITYKDSPNNNILKYSLIAIGILLLIFIVLIFIKKNKPKTLLIIFILASAIFSSSGGQINANAVFQASVNQHCAIKGESDPICIYYRGILANEAVKLCGPKPADTCVQEKIMTHACTTDTSCTTTVEENTRVMKLLSPSVVVDKKSDRVMVGPVSVSVDMCETLGTMANGESFYIITDKANSDWIKERYSIYEYRKGTAATLSNTPYTRKTNSESVAYDGNCNLTVTSRYSGTSSNYRSAQVNIVELGKVESTMCKSKKVVSSAFYPVGNNFVSLPNCQNKELYDTFVSNGEILDIKSNRVWVGPVSVSVDMCETLGTMANGESFYIITDKANSDWIKERYSIYEYRKGTVATLSNTPFSSGSGLRTNSEWAVYDGNCIVTLNSQYSGRSSDFKHAQAYLVEIGKFSTATCRSPLIAGQDFYKAGGEYQLLPYCTATNTNTSQCKNNYKWVPSQTNNNCDVDDDPTVVCNCVGRNQVCSKNGAATTTAINVPFCSLSAYCSVNVTLDNKVDFTITPYNAIGNIRYQNGTSTVIIPKSESFKYSVAKAPGIQAISVLLTDLQDNQTVTSSCFVDNPPIEIEPPSISIERTPPITLNKGGNCTITWKIQNLPRDGSCTLTGDGQTIDVSETGSEAFGPINVNTRFTLSCTNTQPYTVEPVSTICRINSEIMEN